MRRISTQPVSPPSCQPGHVPFHMPTKLPNITPLTHLYTKPRSRASGSSHRPHLEGLYGGYPIRSKPIRDFFISPRRVLPAVLPRIQESDGWREGVVGRACSGCGDDGTFHQFGDSIVERS